MDVAVAMQEDAADTFTTYSYRNVALAGTSKEVGVLWHDSTSHKICWQCTGKVTPWHGAFVDDGDQRKLFFNAGTTPETITFKPLRSTVLLRDPNGDWIGHDYKGRQVIMRPLAQYKWVTSGFMQTASWCLDSKSWQSSQTA